MTYLDISVMIFILSASANTVTSQFQNLPNSISVPENTTGDTYLFTIIIGERNFFPLNYLIQYEPSTGSDIFLITNALNGFDVTLRPGTMLDFETLPNQYRIVVIDLTAAEGSGEGERQPPIDPNNLDSVVLEINITDVNEPPRFGDAKYYRTVPESKIPMDPFIPLPSPAIDEDVNDTLSYEINNIFPSAVGKLFDINRTTGNIVLLEEYDVDKNVNPDVIIITIEAVDQLGLSDTTMLFVYINDLNDNVPVFTGNGSYVILLPDDYTKITGVDIGYVHADDADGSDTITYSIVPQNMYFSVGSSTGFIQLISSLPLDTENAGVFQLSIVASTAVRGNYVTATVTVFIVPFCTADAEMTCDLCNESSSNTSVPSQSTTTVPTTDPQNGPVNTCPETMCSKCGAYITNTCSSGAVPPASQPVCSSQSDVTFANLPFCWIVPLTVAVGVAAVIIGLSLYKRQQKRKTANTIKPDVTTVESIN